jgi:hypothetical protein
MEYEHPHVKKCRICPEMSNRMPNGLSESSQCGVTASQELACMEKLLLADWRGNWGKPLTADDLLPICSKAFESLFQEPPIGPVPEYLVPHLSVYGCVAEYEEKIEELDRWKALQLSLWLKDMIGRRWCVAGKVYQLQVEKQEAVGSERFWFRLIEGQTG